MTENPSQLLTCTWAPRIKDGWEEALISHAEQPTPATSQTYNDSCRAHRHCQLSVCIKLAHRQPVARRRIDGKEQLLKSWKTGRSRRKCLPVSVFKALLFSVSSLPRRQWEHGEKKRKNEKRNSKGRPRGKSFPPRRVCRVFFLYLPWARLHNMPLDFWLCRPVIMYCTLPWWVVSCFPLHQSLPSIVHGKSESTKKPQLS